MREHEQPEQDASLENAKETNAPPVEISDLRVYLAYLIDHTRKVAAETTDEKNRERKEKVKEKFSGIASRISTHCSNHQIDSVEDLIISLDEERVSYDERLDTAYSNKDEKEINRIEKALQQLEETKDFIDRFNLDHLRQKPFLEWQNAQNKQSAVQRSETQKAERAKSDQEMKEIELMLSVITDGSAGLYASMPSGYANSQERNGGFEGLLDSRRIEKDRAKFARDIGNEFGLNDRNLKHKYDEAHVREFIGLVPATQDTYEEIETPVTEKRWGGLLSKTTIEKQKVKTGERPVLHNEAVVNGKNEPLMKLWYSVQSNANDNGSLDLAYRDGSGRPGNILRVEVLLPESAALKIMQEIESNPAFIRKIAEEVILKKIGIPEKVWREGEGTTEKYPLRPPYEKWDTDSGGKFYIKKPDDEYGFNPERVVTIKR